MAENDGKIIIITHEGKLFKKHYGERHIEWIF